MGGLYRNNAVALLMNCMVSLLAHDAVVFMLVIVRFRNDVQVYYVVLIPVFIPDKGVINC